MNNGDTGFNWWNGSTKSALQVLVSAIVSVATILGIQTANGYSTPVPSPSVLEQKLDRQTDSLQRMEVVLGKIEENTRK